MTREPVILSALIVAHNEEAQLTACLDCLTFADEIVVVLDKCTDGSKEIAARYTDRLVEGSWEREGARRNLGIESCRGDWVVEIDADERLPAALAEEIRRVIAASAFDYHPLPVDNYIGSRLVRHGWCGSYGKSQYVGLFRPQAKRWGLQRVHPSLTLSGREGPVLQGRVEHWVDRDLSDMIQRLDRYSTLRARDLRERMAEGRFRDSVANNIRRLFSRFFKCYVLRRGYREGGYGLLLALFAGLFPLLSHLKATLEDR